MGNRVQSLDEVEKGVPGELPTRSGSRDDQLEMSIFFFTTNQITGVGCGSVGRILT